MRKIIYIISLCMAVGLAACGTSGKQAKTKSQQAEFVKIRLLLNSAENLIIIFWKLYA